MQRKKMKNEKALTPQIVQEPEYSGANLPVTRADFDTLSEQRKMLVEFVAKQMRKDVDYGIVPGTNKNSLYKPGAEKLARLFGLGARFAMVDKVLDGQGNFALYTYKCIVYHLKTNHVIAECEGTCNSQEKKYKERTVWEWSERARKKEPRKEATAVYDILNTLQKMAQKRAYVGAVILATGASDFFTQDIDDADDAKNIGATPEIKDTPNAVPTVTRVTSETQMKHDNQDQGVYWAEAMTEYDDRHLVKEAGFKWDKNNKKWIKQITPAEAGGLPFETKRIS
jgi:hypothetical protein